MKRKWERDLGLQGRMLFTMFLLAVVYLFFLAILSYYGTPPIFMLLFVGLFMGIQYFYSDKMVLWTTGAHIVSESEAPQLHGMITRLCAIADLPKPQVAIVRTQVPNAFATGRSPNKAVVAVTTGILDKLSPAELEAVLAHELSHVKNRDMAVLTIASFISTVAFYFMRYGLYFGNMGGGQKTGRRRKFCTCLVSFHCSLGCQFSPDPCPFPLQGICCRQRLCYHYRAAV